VASLIRYPGDGTGGNGVQLVPPGNGLTYSSVIIWMHGLGDTAEGWSQLMASINIEKTKIILPTANVRPITLNGGRRSTGWFDVQSLDGKTSEDIEGFASSTARIHKLISKEVRKGISEDRIVIGGFSQGGALSLHISIRYPKVLCGCISLSAWLPFRDEYPLKMSNAASTLRIWQAHGNRDNMVSLERGRTSHEILRSSMEMKSKECDANLGNGSCDGGERISPYLKIYEGMGHTTNQNEIDDLTVILKKWLKK